MTRVMYARVLTRDPGSVVDTDGRVTRGSAVRRWTREGIRRQRRRVQGGQRAQAHPRAQRGRAVDGVRERGSLRGGVRARARRVCRGSVRGHGDQGERRGGGDQGGCCWCAEVWLGEALSDDPGSGRAFIRTASDCLINLVEEMIECNEASKIQCALRPMAFVMSFVTSLDSQFIEACPSMSRIGPPRLPTHRRGRARRAQWPPTKGSQEGVGNRKVRCAVRVAHRIPAFVRGGCERRFRGCEAGERQFRGSRASSGGRSA